MLPAMAILWTLDGAQLPNASPFSLFSGGDVTGLSETALRDIVIIALFTDRRADAGEILPVPNGDRRGYWADGLVAPEDQGGSRLWLLERALANEETASLAQGYAAEALAFMVRIGLAASVAVVGELVRFAGSRPNAVGLNITIERGDRDDLNLRFDAFWEGLDRAG